MGPPSYMQAIIEGNVRRWRMTVQWQKTNNVYKQFENEVKVSGS
jgi:hypothetical protein